LVAPFSPQRYIDAINDFAKTGIEVLIIDSITHEHEGPGGLLDIAGQDNKYWNRAKSEHKRFVNALLQSDMHIIVCVRAREKITMERVRDGNGNLKTEIEDAGLQPVTEKNLMFEMSASLMMHAEGKKQTLLKVPGDLMAVLGRGEGYITAADGKHIRDWVDGAKQLDPTVEKFRNRLLSVCEKGESYIAEAWSKTPAGVQTSLGPKFREMLSASAKAYDQARIDAETAQAEAAPVSVQTGVPAAIAAAALAGRAARTDTTPIKTEPPIDARPPKADPPKAEIPKAAESAAPKADAPPPKSAAHAAHAAAAAKLPLATPPAASRQPLSEPMF
jgi:hypothetical protein